MSLNKDLLKLERGSFRGVPFIVQTDQMEFGRKKVVHEFINSDRRYIEDLGLVNDSFNIDCYVSSSDTVLGNAIGLISSIQNITSGGDPLSGNDVISKRDSLLAALKKDGPGLLIHPQYGRKIVHIEKGTVRHMINEVGIAYFNFTALESQDNLYPGSSNNNPSTINKTGLSGLQNSVNNFRDNYRTGLLTGATLLDGISKARSLSTLFSGIYERFRSGDASQFLSGITSFNNEIPALVQQPEDYGNGVVTLLGEADDFGVDSEERFNIARATFDFGDDDIQILKIKTAHIDDQIFNRKQVDILTQIGGLIQAYRNASKINYMFDQQLENTKKILNNQFDKIDSTYDISFDLKRDLYAIRDEATNYFKTVSVDVKKIIEIQVRKYTPLRVLCHQYYGNQDNFSILRQLNPYQHASFFVGQVKIVEPT